MKRFKFSSDTGWISPWRFSKNLIGKRLILFNKRTERKVRQTTHLLQIPRAPFPFELVSVEKAKKFFAESLWEPKSRQLVNQGTSCTTWFEIKAHFSHFEKVFFTFHYTGRKTIWQYRRDNNLQLVKVKYLFKDFVFLCSLRSVSLNMITKWSVEYSNAEEKNHYFKHGD